MKPSQKQSTRQDPVRGVDKANSNHGISAQKFQLIKEFLTLGCASHCVSGAGRVGRGWKSCRALCGLRPPPPPAAP